MDNGNLSFFSDCQRKAIQLISQITSKRRQFMINIEESTHRQLDSILEEVTYDCQYCSQQFKGKQIGAHYRNQQQCKYMRDRPWLKTLPKDWKIDLQRFIEENQSNEERH